jgi:hypothetical protein
VGWLAGVLAGGATGAAVVAGAAADDVDAAAAEVVGAVLPPPDELHAATGAMNANAAMQPAIRMWLAFMVVPPTSV